jgi:hypothetical protein
MKLVPEAQYLFNQVMERLDYPTHSMYEEPVPFSCEQKYHILRYLTNMLETEEEKLYKKMAETFSTEIKSL